LGTHGQGAFAQQQGTAGGVDLIEGAAERATVDQLRADALAKQQSAGVVDEILGGNVKGRSETPHPCRIMPATASPAGARHGRGEAAAFGADAPLLPMPDSLHPLVKLPPIKQRW
jgi:hypothetical protein